MAVFQTFAELPATGLGPIGWGGTIREDLQDFITNVSPQDVPLLSGLRQVRVNSVFVEWLEDQLPERGTNAVNEGVAFTETTVSLGVRCHNHVQTFYQAGMISDLERAVGHAGVGDPYVYEEHKKFLQLRGDIEHAIHRGTMVTGSSSVPRQLAGILNIPGGHVTVTSAFSLGDTVGGEDAFNGMLEVMYNLGDVQPTELYCGPRIKRKIAKFSTKVQRNIPAADRRQVLSVDVYDSDFGTTRIYLSRDQLQRADNLCSWAVIDPRYLLTGWLRPMSRENLSRDGLRDRFQMSAAATLIFKTKKAVVGAIHKEYA